MGDAMEKKLGVYICKGCEIAERLDVDKLSALAKSEYNPPVLKTLDAACGDAGVAEMKADIDGEGINTLIIAACSSRVHWDTFDFGADKIVERVSLREGVVWSHELKEGTAEEESAEEAAAEETEEEEEVGGASGFQSGGGGFQSGGGGAFQSGGGFGGGGDVSAKEWDQDDVQMLAEDYIRMGIVKAQKTEMPEPYEDEFVKKVLVIGGGVTGMKAALEVADTGYDVLIVEREQELGGYAKKVRKHLPTEAPFTDLQTPTLADDLIKKVNAHERIEVRTGHEVARIGGAPAMFEVSFKVAGSTSQWDVPPKKEAGDEEEAEKETQAEGTPPDEVAADLQNCEDILNKDPDAERFGAVVVAAGWKPYEPEDGEFAHLGYGTLKNVMTNVQFEELAAKGKTNFKSVAFIQSPGVDGDDRDFPYASSVTSMVALKQARYVRDDHPADGKSFIFYKHMRTPGRYEHFYKNIQDEEGIFLTRGEVVSVAENGGNLTVTAKDTLLGEDIKVEVDAVVLATGMVPATKDEPIINLAYRQGPEFIDLELFDGYADSNYICFPYETRRTGIYSAGCVRQTLPMADCMEDATGAALKAIQCMESSNRGMAVHPRSGDTSYPEFYFQRCTQCKRCTEECPFGALDDDEKGTPKPNPTRCRRCGTCMGACPERIISFKNYSIDMIGSMVKECEVPEEDDGKYRIIAFVCENDALPALDMAARNKVRLNPYIRYIPVRCLGSVNVIWIADAMSKGFDGAILIGCKYGDDYQCHFAKGSELANRRMENVADTLKRLALEPERVTQVQLAIDEYDKLPGILDEFLETIEGVGFNPMKGF